MSCPHCAVARAGIWGRWSERCEQCRARLISRSLAAFHAFDPKGSGGQQALIDAVLKAMPTTNPGIAIASVRRWWLNDQSQKDPAAPRSAWIDDA